MDAVTILGMFLCWGIGFAIGILVMVDTPRKE